MIPAGSGRTLLALLIGTNIGPVVTPWASLATLLRLDSCRSHGLTLSMRTFVLTGLGLAVTALAMLLVAG